MVHGQHIRATGIDAKDSIVAVVEQMDAVAISGNTHVAAQAFYVDRDVGSVHQIDVAISRNLRASHHSTGIHVGRHTPRALRRHEAAHLDPDASI
jgi:hypothetical protein